MKQYDYTNQAWYDTVTGRYIGCSHPSGMDCGCYGRLHEGQINNGTTYQGRTTMNHGTSKYSAEYESGTDREVVEYTGKDIGHLFLALLEDQFASSNDPLADSINWLEKRWDRNAIYCDPCYRMMGQVIDEIKSWDE